MDAKRVGEIERRLADLGVIDGWKADIDSMTGDLLIRLPSQFGWNEGLDIGNMEGSTQADHALLEFLGDAPHAIRELLADNRAAYDLLETILGDTPTEGLTWISTAQVADWLQLRTGKEAAHAST